MSPEEKIGAAVSAYLRRQGFAVYADVVGPWGKERPDIVAVGCGGTVHVVECKVALGWPVISQALPWREWADSVSVATAPSYTHQRAKEGALRGLRLGWAHVADDGVGFMVEPAQNPVSRGRVEILLDALRPEQQQSAPGNARSEFWTATDEQRRALAAVVAGVAVPGLPLVATLREVLGKTPNAETRRAWAKAIRMGQVPGVRCEVRGRRVVLLPDAVTAEGVL